MVLASFKPQLPSLLPLVARSLRQKLGWGPMRGFVAATQGRRSTDGRTDERHFVDAIATLLATTDGDEDEDMWQFANNGPPLLDKEGLLSSCPTVPRAFSALLSFVSRGKSS